jgi:hypothetical protein
MPRIEDDDNVDGDNDDSGDSPSRNIMLRIHVVPGVDTATESDFVPDDEGNVNVPRIQGFPSQNMRRHVPVGAHPYDVCGGTVGGHDRGSTHITNLRRRAVVGDDGGHGQVHGRDRVRHAAP